MNEEIELKEVKKYTGSYDGITFEINNYQTNLDNSMQEHWTYYIYLHLDRIPEENDPTSFWLKARRIKNHKNRVFYDNYKHPIIPELDWHGGCTWYSKELGFDRVPKIIKIGCDYAHYNDEGQYYSLNYVKSDAIQTIRKFRELVPNYKYYCCGNGKLCNLSDGILHKNKFYSNEYWSDKDWFKELKNENKDKEVQD